MLRKAGPKERAPGKIGSLRTLAHLSQNYLVYPFRVNSRPPYRFFHNGGRQHMGRYALKRPSISADCRAHAARNIYVFHI